MRAAIWLPSSFMFAYSLHKIVLDKCPAMMGRDSFLPRHPARGAYGMSAASVGSGVQPYQIGVREAGPVSSVLT